MSKRRNTVTAAIISLAISSVGLAQDDDWLNDENVERVLAVEKALPPHMITGPHYRVVSPVVNILGLDYFHIESDYGNFDAYGQLMLRLRLREIYALDVLDDVKTSDIAKDSLKREGKKAVESVTETVKHPIFATKGIAKGLGTRFKRFTRDVKESVDTARADLSAEEKARIYGNRWLGVDKAKRRWAGKLNVDPYSTNETLQAELDRVAVAEAKSNIGAKFVMPQIPGTEFIRDVYSVVTTYDYRQLMEHNRKQLQGLGAASEDIEYFQSLEYYNPTAASMLIGTILELNGVDNRLALFEQALITQSVADGIFFMESVLMATWYHSTQAPLDRMLLVLGVPAAMTRDGRVVVFSASDFPHWTDTESSMALQVHDAYKDLSNRRELLIAGNGSSSLRREVEALGWSIRLHLRNDYLPRFPWAITDAEMQAGN